MIKYTEEFFMKLEKDTNKLLKLLQEYKFSGSYETKLDLNTVIKLISNQAFVINELRKNLKEVQNV